MLKAVFPSALPPVSVPVPVIATVPPAVRTPPLCAKPSAKLAVFVIVRTAPVMSKTSSRTVSELTVKSSLPP